MGRKSTASPCGHEGCVNNAWGKKFCSTHFTHLRLYGETRDSRHISRTGICTVAECGQPHKAKGYCKRHYELAKYHGELAGSKCEESGCLLPRKKRGYCLTHYMRKRRSGEFGGEPCLVGSCSLPATNNGLCYRHDRRSRKYVMSIEEMERLDAGVDCEICGETADAVDHNHQTGFVRGYLCKPCNSAIGLLKDNPAVIRSAANYLERKGYVSQIQRANAPLSA